MRADRLLIGAVLFVGGGIGTLLTYCHGTAGLGVALPVAGTKFNLDITTMGVPVLVGVPLFVIGLALLLIAFFAAIVAQFRPTHAAQHNGLPGSRPLPLD